jgi:hypothetical protein
MAWFRLKMFPAEGITPPPLIVVLVMSGLETTPNAKSAAVIVEVNRTNLFVWIEDIDNSSFMNVCTIYRFIKSVFLSMGKLCYIDDNFLKMMQKLILFLGLFTITTQTGSNSSSG